MKQDFFSLFFDFKVAFYYYVEYSRWSSKQRLWLSAGCAVASMVFVGSWYLSKSAPLLWALLTMACQIVSVLQPFFPYENRLHAANYISQDLNDLLRDMESDWLNVMQKDDRCDLSQMIKDYQLKYDKIENRFSNSDTFPDNRRIHDKACQKASTYFKKFQERE